MNSNLKVFFYIHHLFAPMLFFSVYAILGWNYIESGQNIIYSGYLVLSSLITYTIFLDEILRRKFLSKTVMILLLFAVSICLSGLFYLEFEFVKAQLSLLVVMVIPSIFGGHFLANMVNKVLLKKMLIIFSVLVVLGVLRVLPTLLNVSVIELLDVYGGGQYQALSYFCAFSALVLFSRLLEHSNRRYWLKIITLLSIIVLLFGIILSGGRGGLLVVIVGSLLLIKYKLGFNFFRKHFWVAISVFILILPLGSSFDFFSDRLDESYNRLFSFVSSEGINMEGSSNRDDFYSSSLKLFNDRPVFGYGFFGTVKHLGNFYPHNLFLELLLHGGISLLVVSVFVLFVFISKLNQILKVRRDEEVILIVVVYVFLMLMVSSSYLQEPGFWFSLSYVFSYPSIVKIEQ